MLCSPLRWQACANCFSKVSPRSALSRHGCTCGCSRGTNLRFGLPSPSLTRSYLSEFTEARLEVMRRDRSPSPMRCKSGKIAACRRRSAARHWSGSHRFSSGRPRTRLMPRMLPGPGAANDHPVVGASQRLDVLQVRDDLRGHEIGQSVALLQPPVIFGQSLAALRSQGFARLPQAIQHAGNVIGLGHGLAAVADIVGRSLHTFSPRAARACSTATKRSRSHGTG